MPYRAAKSCSRCRRPHRRRGNRCATCASNVANVPARKRAKQPQSRWHHLYNDRAWRRARKEFFSEPYNKVCRLCRKRLATVVDHIKPHKGDLALFWDRDNWQPACVRCHNAKSATEK